MPTAGVVGRGFHSDPDFRELVGRLSFSRKMARQVSFSPNEAWVLLRYMHFLAEHENPAWEKVA